MPTQKTQQSEEQNDWIGSYFHVYNRGVEKREIFSGNQDYQRFLRALAAANATHPIHISNFYRGPTLVEILSGISEDERLIDVGAYCLMPNHFHLLVREKRENGLAKFMQKFSTAYTMYFNTKYERSGALFQGSYKAKLVEHDQYLRHLFTYIHLNPIALAHPDWETRGIEDIAAAQRQLLAYAYSSYPDYIGVIRDENYLVNKEAFPAYFSSATHFADLHAEWLSYRNENALAAASTEVQPR